MLSASPLGLHLRPVAIPILRKCLGPSGAIIGHKSFLFACRSSSIHLSLRPHQASRGERPDTESFRQDAVVYPVSLFVENKASSDLRSSRVPVQEGASEGECKFMTAVGREGAIGTNFSTQDAIVFGAARVVGEVVSRKSMSPSRYFVQEAPFLSGRPWARQKIKPLRATPENGYGYAKRLIIPSPEDVISDVAGVYQDMLHVLATTSCSEDGWKAYTVLSRLQQHHDASNRSNEVAPIIPFAHLHRLARVIVQNKPKTRSQFLQLLSVLTTIQNHGGEIQLHEWNALIDHAGKGWRKTRPEDFNNSLSIYYDMIHNRPPGSRFSDIVFDDSSSFHDGDDLFSLHPPPTPVVEPDIHTYTTLIDIAARTNLAPVLHRATMLLKQAKLPPNRITHLSLLKYFTAQKQLSGVRSTLARMREQNLSVGVDGLNACMWAYGHSNRADIVVMIYRLLRHNLVAEEPNEYDGITSVQERLLTEEGIGITPDLRPNEITFTVMIQTMAYHGNLLGALSVFVDMLSSPNVEQGAPLVVDKDGELQPIPYSPTIHVFRAILLGFSRHGVNSRTRIIDTDPSDTDPDKLEWNLDNLQHIFKRFLELPPDTRISESTVFWILNAFSRTSGHNDKLLQTVWIRMEDRFGKFKEGPNHRVRRWRNKLFPETRSAE